MPEHEEPGAAQERERRRGRGLDAQTGGPPPGEEVTEERNGAPRERSRHQPYYNGGFRAFRDNIFDLEPWVIFLGHLFDPLAQLGDTAPSLALILHDRVRGEGHEHRLHVLTIDRLEVRLEWFRQLRLQRDLLLNCVLLLPQSENRQ